MVDNSPNEYVYNATVRYCLTPKLKGMKLKAARNALTAAACAVGKVSPSKKKREGKFVHSQSIPPGTSLPDAAPIDLKVGKKPKKHA